jgi:hypothetical protein
MVPHIVYWVQFADFILTIHFQFKYVWSRLWLYCCAVFPSWALACIRIQLVYWVCWYILIHCWALYTLICYVVKFIFIVYSDPRGTFHKFSCWTPNLVTWYLYIITTHGLKSVCAAMIVSWKDSQLVVPNYSFQVMNFLLLDLWLGPLIHDVHIDQLFCRMVSTDVLNNAGHWIDQLRFFCIVYESG